MIVTLADFFVRDSFIADHHEVHVLKRSFVGTLIIATPELQLTAALNVHSVHLLPWNHWTNFI